MLTVPHFHTFHTFIFHFLTYLQDIPLTRIWQMQIEAAQMFFFFLYSRIYNVPFKMHPHIDETIRLIKCPTVHPYGKMRHERLLRL